MHHLFNFLRNQHIIFEGHGELFTGSMVGFFEILVNCFIIGEWSYEAKETIVGDIDGVDFGLAADIAHVCIINISRSSGGDDGDDDDTDEGNDDQNDDDGHFAVLAPHLSLDCG